MSLNAVFLFIGGLGGSEVMVIMLVILLLFGANKIPDLAKGLGRGIREFKDATNGIKTEIEKSINDEPTSQHTYTPEPVHVEGPSIDNIMNKKRRPETFTQTEQDVAAVNPEISSPVEEPKQEENKIAE
ncbi:twin-arginine translocase TatA/TatE family subunit [Adhaeribacter aquaticus]|uniref:twin-arginine translocase TatA/TatE family subunit n=1 Tax=Adhaeribacter aquaticus TaxID=299567 RepID=UPI00040185ED